MKTAALLLWILPLVVGYLAYQYYGPPSLIWSYSYRQMGPVSGFSNRYYTSCTYVGWGFEMQHVPAPGGKCPLVRFLARAS